MVSKAIEFSESRPCLYAVSSNASYCSWREVTVLKSFKYDSELCAAASVCLSVCLSVCPSVCLLLSLAGRCISSIFFCTLSDRISSWRERRSHRQMRYQPRGCRRCLSVSMHLDAPPIQWPRHAGKVASSSVPTVIAAKLPRNLRRRKIVNSNEYDEQQ